MSSMLKIEDIIREIGGFLNRKEFNFDVYNSINESLEFCLNLPTVNLVSIFLLNEDSYEFEHRFTLPREFKDLSKEFFNFLLENGFIGEALEKGSHISVDLSKNVLNIPSAPDINEYLVILPLISSTKVIGLLLVKMLNQPDKIKREDLIIILELLARFFALLIENMLLQNTLGKTNDFIEQDSALKSIDLKRNLIEIESIINSLEVGIFIIDPETDEIKLSNYYSAKLTGLKQSELNGKKISEIFRTEQSLKEFSRKQDIFISGSKNFESAIISKTGKLIPVIRSVSITNIRTKKYRIDSFVDISFRKEKDEILENEKRELELKYQERTEDLLVVVSKLKEEIKEKEKVQKEIQNMLDKEKELNAMKSNFITMVSHEFRSPLTKIKSAAQMIEKFGNKLTDEEKNDYIKRIINIVDQMSGLLENVSLIGGTDLFDLDFDPKETDVLFLLRQLVSNLNINYGKTDKVLLTTDSEKIIAVIDERLFRIICFNALTNIIKNSNEDDQINIFIGDSDDELVLILNDIKLNINQNEYEIIKRLITEGKIIDDLPSACINWSVVVKSVKIHEGSMKFIEKGGNIFSIVINIPIISQKNKK